VIHTRGCLRLARRPLWPANPDRVQPIDGPLRWS